MIRNILDKWKNFLSENLQKEHLFVFDFDDTLVKTDSRVVVRDKHGRAVKKLTSDKFQEYDKPPGYSYDKREFDYVIDPEVVEHVFNSFRYAIKHYPSCDVVILTARAHHARENIKAFLEHKGIPTEKINIVTLDTNEPEAKTKWIRNKIVEQSYQSVKIFEDSKDHIEDMKENLPGGCVEIIHPEEGIK